jgi:cellulose synthase/poly-beta-1,6-N-acetylglucosamine synthase-like glycosyltransferase
MSAILTILALLLLAQSLVALAAALRFAHYALRSSRRSSSAFQPKAIVIVPCKGIDLGIEQNLKPLFEQNYPDYDLVFVTESESDPAYPLINKLIRQSSRSAWMVVAGEAQGCGQKVHNLRAALNTVRSIDRRSEVLVFADADARPGRDWLAGLVAPLVDRGVGATTGFRWYQPLRLRMAPLLLSSWNASALTLLSERSSFAWGGATGIRRDTFESLEIMDAWSSAVSDDYVLTRAVQMAGLRVKFVPAALMLSGCSSGWRELIEFTTRQMTITRVYAPHVWRLALISHLLFNITFWGGLIFAVARSKPVLEWLLPAIFLAGVASAAIRKVVAGRVLTRHLDREAGRSPYWTWLGVIVSPVVSLLYLYNLAASAWTRRITWRGIGYEMVSPSETLVRRQPEPACVVSRDSATTKV